MEKAKKQAEPHLQARVLYTKTALLKRNNSQVFDALKVCVAENRWNDALVLLPMILSLQAFNSATLWQVVQLILVNCEVPSHTQRSLLLYDQNHVDDSVRVFLVWLLQQLQAFNVEQFDDVYEMADTRNHVITFPKNMCRALKALQQFIIWRNMFVEEKASLALKEEEKIAHPQVFHSSDADFSDYSSIPDFYRDSSDDPENTSDFQGDISRFPREFSTEILSQSDHNEYGDPQTSINEIPCHSEANKTIRDSKLCKRGSKFRQKYIFNVKNPQYEKQIVTDESYSDAESLLSQSDDFSPNKSKFDDFKKPAPVSRKKPKIASYSKTTKNCSNLLSTVNKENTNTMLNRLNQNTSFNNSQYYNSLELSNSFGALDNSQNNDGIMSKKVKDFADKAFVLLRESISQLQSSCQRSHFVDVEVAWLIYPMYEVSEILKKNESKTSDVSQSQFTMKKDFECKAIIEKYVKNNLKHLPAIKLYYSFVKITSKNVAVEESILKYITCIAPYSSLVLKYVNITIKKLYKVKVRSGKCCLNEDCLSDLLKCLNIVCFFLEFKNNHQNEKAWEYLSIILGIFHKSWLKCFECKFCVESREKIKSYQKFLVLWPKIFWNECFFSSVRSDEVIISCAYASFVFGYNAIFCVNVLGALKSTSKRKLTSLLKFEDPSYKNLLGYISALDKETFGGSKKKDKIRTLVLEFNKMDWNFNDDGTITRISKMSSREKKKVSDAEIIENTEKITELNADAELSFAMQRFLIENDGPEFKEGIDGKNDSLKECDQNETSNEHFENNVKFVEQENISSFHESNWSESSEKANNHEIGSTEALAELKRCRKRKSCDFNSPSSKSKNDICKKTSEKTFKSTSNTPSSTDGESYKSKMIKKRRKIASEKVKNVHSNRLKSAIENYSEEFKLYAKFPKINYKVVSFEENENLENVPFMDENVK